MEDFSLANLVANRTDSNQQFFELAFSHDLDLIQVLSHKLFHHESDGHGRVDMKSHQNYLDLTSDPKTIKVFETYT